MKNLSSWVRCMMVAAMALGVVAAGAEDGVTKSGIVIGQSIALTGPGSALAAPFHQGAKLYFDRLNASGGINGRRIELVTLDDKNQPPLALEQLCRHRRRTEGRRGRN